MPNFQDTFKTCKQSFVSAFSVCMTVPLMEHWGFCLLGYRGQRESDNWDWRELGQCSLGFVKFEKLWKKYDNRKNMISNRKNFIVSEISKIKGSCSEALL